MDQETLMGLGVIFGVLITVFVIALTIRMLWVGIVAYKDGIEAVRNTTDQFKFNKVDAKHPISIWLLIVLAVVFVGGILAFSPVDIIFSLAYFLVIGGIGRKLKANS